MSTPKIRDISPLLPAYVNAFYPRRRCTGAPDRPVPGDYDSTTPLTDITLTDPAALPRPIGSLETVVVRDTAVALTNGTTSAPTNQAALDALTKAIAQDYYDWRTQSFDVVYNGTCAVVPSGLLDLISFRYDELDQVTRVQSAPWSGYPQEFQHQDPAISACATADDRAPGILMDIPLNGVAPGAQGLLTLEDGRLVMSYVTSVALPCACGSTTCGSICTSVTACQSPAQPRPGALVTILIGAGTGATATATLTGGVVTALTLTAGGTGFVTAPVVNFTASTFATAATATATVSGGAVTALTLTGGGSGYTSTPSVSFGGGGSGSTLGTCTTDGVVASVTFFNAGTGYTSAPTVSFTGGGGSGAAATATITGGTIGSLTVTSGGAGYTAAPTLTMTGGGGTGATASATVFGGAVTSCHVTAAGSGYTSSPTVGFAGGGGAGAAATANVVSGHLSTLTLTAGGTGYTAAPTVVFSGGGGSGAAATAGVSSKCCVPYNAAGLYTIVVTQTHYPTTTTTLNASTCTGATVVANVNKNPTTVSVTVQTTSYCQAGSLIEGVTVTAKISGSPVASGTSDSSGTVTFDVPVAASVEFSGFSARTTMGTHSEQVFACNQAFVTVSGSGVESGYQCLGGSCTEPIATSVTLADSLLGDYTLAYTASNPANGIAGWGGGKNISYPGRMTGYTITHAGSGYVTPPNATVTGGGGTGATLGYVAGNLVVTNGGTGYTSAPTITFDPAPPGIGHTTTTATATFCAPATAHTYFFMQGGAGAGLPPILTFFWSATAPGGTNNCPCAVGGGGCTDYIGILNSSTATSFACPESGAFMAQFAVSNPGGWNSPLYDASTQTVTE